MPCYTTVALACHRPGTNIAFRTRETITVRPGTTSDRRMVRTLRSRRVVRPLFIPHAGGGEDGYRGGPVYVGGLTPEAKAGKALAKLFTFVAAKTIMVRRRRIRHHLSAMTFTSYLGNPCVNSIVIKYSGGFSCPSSESFARVKTTAQKSKLKLFVARFAVSFSITVDLAAGQ
jgi:hypothetical protein